MNNWIRFSKEKPTEDDLYVVYRRRCNAHKSFEYYHVKEGRWGSAKKIYDVMYWLKIDDPRCIRLACVYYNTNYLFNCSETLGDIDLEDCQISEELKA